MKGPRRTTLQRHHDKPGRTEAPILITISTQAADDADLFSIWIDDAKESGDPRIVCVLYSAPKDATLQDKKAWKEAHRLSGIPNRR